MAAVTLAVSDGDASYQFQVAHDDGWSLQVLVVSTSFSAGSSGATVQDAVTFVAGAIAAADDVTSFNGAKFGVSTISL